MINIDQIALLFERDRSVISKHIKNIFLEGELNENTVCAFFAHTVYKLAKALYCKVEDLLEDPQSV